jgi:hypothetical protein
VTRLTAALGLVLLAARPVAAENVDLSTVPARHSVQLTIYNSEDLTLVRETRKVSFRPGVNPLQFSWAGTLIDPTSVELRFLNHPDKLTVLDTTFPHAKPQMLYWNVQSELDGEALIEITYFTSGISWSADYVCIADRAEKAMALEGFVRVSNGSGEEYEDAQVRLVVGRINLVEKIEQLARIGGKDLSRMDRAQKVALQYRALRHAAKARAEPGDDLDAGGVNSMTADKPKQVAKEGLGEYFIFTIEGTETIHSGWSKRMRSLEAAAVPLAIQYRYRPAEYGEQLVRMYLVRNDKQSKLGSTPLPDGVVRVFRSNGRDGLSFLVAQPIKYVPIGERIELNLGRDPEVIFELVKHRTWRDAVWVQVQGANIYRRVDQPGVQIELNSSVAGWDDHVLFAQRVRNYTARPIELEIRRSFPGDVLFRSPLAARNHDYQTVEYTAAVQPGEKVDLPYEVVQRQGHNATQNKVAIERRK